MKTTAYNLKQATAMVRAQLKSAFKEGGVVDWREACVSVEFRAYGDNKQLGLGFNVGWLVQVLIAAEAQQKALESLKEAERR